MHVQSYLFFDGRCDEAIAFYQQALNATVNMRMTFAQNPEKPSADCMAPKQTGDKVMHACIRIGQTDVMLSDGRCEGQPKFEGIALSLAVKDAAEATARFNALLEGGGVATMPMMATFFSKAFGMVRDRFGVQWMVMAEG